MKISAVIAISIYSIIRKDTKKMKKNSLFNIKKKKMALSKIKTKMKVFLQKINLISKILKI